MIDAFHDAPRRGIAKTTAAILVATTFIGVTALHADEKKKVTVTIENKTSATVTVTVTGTQLKDYPVHSGNSPRPDINIDSKATSISWEASTSSKKKCDSGSATVTSNTSTSNTSKITINSPNCVDKPTETKKPAEAKPIEAKKDETKKTDKPDETKTMKITFENLMEKEALSLRIWDQVGDPDRSPLEISPIGAGTIDGKPSGFKNTYDFTARKDKSGKFDIEVEWHCGNKGGNQKIKGSVSKIQFVDKCELKK
jgi:hypothetical protein